LAWVDRKVLSWVDHFSVIAKTEKEYLAQVVGENRVVLEQGRKHFKEWQPLDKNKARKKLGIDSKKKVLMYIGSYYKLKGVDHLIEAFQVLKKKYEIELLVIGGLPQDPLYEDLKNSGAIDYGRIPNDQLIWYFSAADIYCAPAIEGAWIKYGGLSTSIIEALACNVPVVSKQLLNFPKEEWKKVGEVPESPEDVIPSIEKILKYPGKYSPRETAKKYYDFEPILKGNINVYDRLFSKYYGV
jgi:glycosyltransferase involved in cell wall biosynthesis